MNKQVVTRMAPSPTGLFHIGSARTALFNYLFTRKNGGKFILRIDDTDRERSKLEYEKNILESFRWLGFDYDEFYRQSERSERYRFFLEKLIAEDKAYWSDETLENGEEIKAKARLAKVIRFRNPGGKVNFLSRPQGELSIDVGDLGDFVIAKDLDQPLYHFASIVDDWEMGVTHVIRGEDHLSNTPRQILMLEALGASRPEYCHIPLILASDRSKLSKRHGALAVTDYRFQGYLPQALTNFVALLGWSPQANTKDLVGTNEEVFDLSQLQEVFSLDGLQKSAAIFNTEKLNWLNHEHLRRLSLEDLQKEVKPFLPERFSALDQYSQERLTKALLPMTERIKNLSELKEAGERGEWDFFFTSVSPSQELLKTPETLIETRKILAETQPAVWQSVEGIKGALWEYATENGRSQVLWPLRVALTGLEKSPDPFTVAFILGKEETLKRLDYAISFLP